MTLHPRQPAPEADQYEIERAWAHRVLDHWKAGGLYSAETIDRCLRLTGDLL